MPSETSTATPPAVPSTEDSVKDVVRALAAAAEPWRSALVATEEELRGLLGRPSTPESNAHTLGQFAVGRIDFERFTGLLARARTMEESSLDRVRTAYETLCAVSARPAVAASRVAPGARLRDAVETALAGIGRAFGAAHQAALARQGTFVAAEHGSLHTSFPFAQWTRRERRIAPPVVIEVDGASLDAADLVRFLDGGVKIGLVVTGPCAPAPLVRLVTPGTFVMQTNDAKAFARLAAAPGPGVAALVPDGAALFVHDPAGGRAPWERTKIDRMPAEMPRRGLGAWSADQLAEELRQLTALAVHPADVAVQAAASRRTGPEAAPGDPAGLLAAWLIEASGAGAA